MQDYENVKLKPKDVRQYEGFSNMSDKEIKSILSFLYGLAKIEKNIATYKNITE
jgi:hypothetical protein